MKKLILMMLVLVCGVGQMKAENIVKIFFQPNSDWASSSASFKLYGYVNENDANAATVVDFALFNNYGNNIYNAEIDLDACPYIRFGRYNSDGSEGWCTTHDTYAPSGSTYYYMTGSNYGDWAYYPSTASPYLPCNYYFLTNNHDNSAWKADALMTEDNGSFIHSFTVSDCDFLFSSISF